MSGLEEGGLTRRRALAVGGSTLAGIMTAGAVGLPAVSEVSEAVASTGSRLPVKRIEEIVQLEGTVDNGVLDISVSREDIGNVHGPEGVVFTPDFEIHGDLFFQPLANGMALLNGDLALLPGELERFIDALIAHDITFQAFHQHFPDLMPMVWFMHFRKVGRPLEVARAIHAAIKTTATPLPQPPASTTTPLDVKRLESILHGSATVENGVVSVTVPRTDRVTLAGHHCRPQTGISTNIEFKPLGGSRANAVPDFSMTSQEVMPVMRTMRGMGWFVGCLYNQETAEKPQLFFSHQLKTGNAYQLAHEIRKGLNHTACA
jgi:hypothetical protein